MPDRNAIQLSTNQPLSSAIEQADVMSLSLLFSLGRYYLDIPFDQSNPIWKINKPTTQLEAPHFLLLEQVGNPVGSATQQPLTALQTALSACHAPGQYSLIFIVTSDGIQNRIYFGVRGHSPTNRSYEFVENLGNFLQGNWPGTRLRRCNNQESPLITSLPKLDYAVALTGVPSLKPGDGQGYPQTLDRLMRGMRGKKFAYVVIAEPVNRTEVDEVIYQCRNLLGLVHSLTKMNLSLAETEGTSEGTNTGHNTGTSTSGMNTDF
ncbi:MAG TPA: ATP-binding protein, partial [Planktothrix sp. UBA10369]|nr:ATP-binding protein [Planktothrix sp. UBA10369]